MSTAQRTRCHGCGAALDPTAFAPIAVRCASCGIEATVPVPASAEIRTVDLGWRALLRGRAWQEAVLARAEGRHVIVDACDRCSGPRLAAMGTPLALRCGHCGHAAHAPIESQVADALPVVALRTYDMDLRWTPAHVPASAGGGPCPSCGAPIPGFTGGRRCDHCSAPLVALLEHGQRFLAGARIEGTDGARTVGAWWPLVAALEHYRRRLEVAEIQKRGTKRTLLVWLLLFLAMPVFFCAMVGVVMLFADRIGPGGVMAVFVTFMVITLGVWVLTLLRPVFETAKKRARIDAIERELAGAWRPPDAASQSTNVT